MRPDLTAELAAQARADLDLLAYPATRWVDPLTTADGTPVHAVIVVGGGQSGLAVAGSLRRDGVDDVVVVDRQPKGREGVWETYARMRELRTPKGLNGLDFGCPSLSIPRWYEARFGAGAWAAIDRVPRTVWMDYLRWYRDTLRLAVENDTEVVDIRSAEMPLRATIGGNANGPSPDGTSPADAVVAVDLVRDGRRTTRLARVVVLASGLDGGGRWQIPTFIAESLPPDRYDHTCGPVDFARLRGRRVAILGHAASAFDNAAMALQAGAASVALCFRRARIPRINPHRFLETAGTMTHFCALPDAVKWRVAHYFRTVDQPPPPTAFKAACAYPNFRIYPGWPWTAVRRDGADIVIESPAGELRADHLLLATGALQDLDARAELRTLAPAVVRWQERYTPPPAEQDARLAALPYLDRHFGFMARHPDDAWVERVLCFNVASFVSQGPHATSISGHRHCIPRLVRGITGRLYRDQQHDFAARLAAFDGVELAVPDDFETRARDSARFADLP